MPSEENSTNQPILQTHRKNTKTPAINKDSLDIRMHKSNVTVHKFTVREQKFIVPKHK